MLDPKILRFVRSRPSIHPTELMRGLSADGHLIREGEADAALVELEAEGVVGTVGIDGKRLVLKPLWRGDIGILTRQRVEECLGRLDNKRFGYTLGNDSVIVFDSTTGAAKIFGFPATIGW